MYKSIVLHERRPEFTRSAFMNHWLNVHAPMSEGARDLHGYVCNEVIEDATPPGAQHLRIDAAVDGIAQMWFERPDGLIALPNSQPRVKKWFSDGPNFIGRRMRFVAEETVLASPHRLEGRTPKLFVFVSRGHELDRPAFQRRLENALRALDSNGLSWLGLALSHIVSGHASSSVTGFPMSAIDSVLEIWISSDEAARNAASTVVQAFDTAIQAEGIRVFLTMETVIRPPRE